MPDAPQFGVPKIRVFDHDLKAAKIEKSTSRGTLDIHCLRHTYATWLAAGGVHPKVAQMALRHSSIDLTMNSYTHLSALDTRAALDSLPVFNAVSPVLPLAQNAEKGDSYLAVNLAVTRGNRGHFQAIPDTKTPQSYTGQVDGQTPRKGPKTLTILDRRCQKMSKGMARQGGLEPSTLSLEG
ncbi:MAG: tyrosine-type recombinase/integrase [Candidatus Hydrogenedentes bacterium]|nr:tyrosine-type recombinase/integrase [Candidatus Hydrogenedentota bacterium]